ncbi:hypothetical protein AXG93_4022s1110 [Marchantia polymorpha subsp. ruderalis]|uniref:Uncharacterized protein n=1 Tax=Marchantia polymorpha subsp. ruderalis TaxID=1480154 RepID=A0A176VZ62_MARPO|nr:hypothetical protein AXG93_4022s1110 [Marchantia polymorpha subsp. ruderalis]
MDLKLLWASDKKLILHIWVHGDLNTATLNFSSQSLVQYSTYVTLSSASSTWATWPDKRRLRKTGRNAAARQTKRKGKPIASKYGPFFPDVRCRVDQQKKMMDAWFRGNEGTGRTRWEWCPFFSGKVGYGSCVERRSQILDVRCDLAHVDLPRLQSVQHSTVLDWTGLDWTGLDFYCTFSHFASV